MNIYPPLWSYSCRFNKSYHKLAFLACTIDYGLCFILHMFQTIRYRLAILFEVCESIIALFTDKLILKCWGIFHLLIYYEYYYCDCHICCHYYWHYYYDDDDDDDYYYCISEIENDSTRYERSPGLKIKHIYANALPMLFTRTCFEIGVIYVHIHWLISMIVSENQMD